MSWFFFLKSYKAMKDNFHLFYNKAAIVVYLRRIIHTVL